MIGIDQVDQLGVVATFQDQAPVVLGEGTSLKELVDLATARLGDRVKDQPAVIAVPAWFHDGQRIAVLEEAKAAGLETIRLFNRPSLVAMAYTAGHLDNISHVLVLDLQANHCDVTVLAKSPHGWDVLATDGKSELPPITASDSGETFVSIDTVIDRALATAELKRDQIGNVLCAGSREVLETIRSRLEDTWGSKVLTLPCPEHAAALGAAIQSALLAKT